MLSEWNDFYKNSPEGKSVSGQKNQQIQGTNSFYIYFCSFVRFTTTFVVFNTYADDAQTLLEDCYFGSNSNDGTNAGGSFRFQGKGNCIQNRVFSCESYVIWENNQGVYCYVSVSNRNNCQNKILDSSVSGSGKVSFKGVKNIFFAIWK